MSPLNSFQQKQQNPEKKLLQQDSQQQPISRINQIKQFILFLKHRFIPETPN
jgi:hypothetical protein